MKFKSCGNYLIVELNDVPREERSAGGIILQQAAHAQAGMSLATVHNIGPNCWTGHYDPDGEWSAWAKEGDVVMIAQYAGQAFPIPDGSTSKEKEVLERMRLIKDDDVLAVVEDNEDE